MIAMLSQVVADVEGAFDRLLRLMYGRDLNRGWFDHQHYARTMANIEVFNIIANVQAVGFRGAHIWELCVERHHDGLFQHFFRWSNMDALCDLFERGAYRYAPGYESSEASDSD